VRQVNDMREALAAEFGLTQDEPAERLPSGENTVFVSRTGWARTYLKKAALIEKPGAANTRSPTAV
jgi:restriction system protein